MKDTWLDIIDSKAFVLSLIASLATLLLVVFFEILDTIIPEKMKIWFRLSFALVIIFYMNSLLKRYRRLKDVESEIEKAKIKNKK